MVVSYCCMSMSLCMCAYRVHAQAAKHCGDGLRVAAVRPMTGNDKERGYGDGKSTAGKSVDQYRPLKTSPPSRLWLVGTSGLGRKVAVPGPVASVGAQRK